MAGLAAKLFQEYRAAHPDGEQAQPVEEKPRFYTRKEAADILGVSLPTIHKMLNDGSIRATKVRRATRIFADHFDQAVKSGSLKKYGRRTR